MWIQCDVVLVPTAIIIQASLNVMNNDDDDDQPGHRQKTKLVEIAETCSLPYAECFCVHNVWSTKPFLQRPSMDSIDCADWNQATWPRQLTNQAVDCHGTRSNWIVSFVH